jgi:type VI secretion system protein VasD
MKSSSILHYAVCAASLLFLAACASTPKPTIVRVALQAQQNVNPDLNGRASPVVVKFYELKSVTAFNAADFFSIFDSEQKTLGAELVGSEVFQLRPGEKLELDRPLNADTRYLAATAAFRDLEHSQWRATLALPPKAKLSRVLVRLDGNKILMGAERECSFPCGITSKKPPPLGNVQEEK